MCSSLSQTAESRHCICYTHECHSLSTTAIRMSITYAHVNVICVKALNANVLRGVGYAQTRVRARQATYRQKKTRYVYCNHMGILYILICARAFLALDAAHLRLLFACRRARDERARLSVVKCQCSPAAVRRRATALHLLRETRARACATNKSCPHIIAGGGGVMCLGRSVGRSTVSDLYAGVLLKSLKRYTQSTLYYILLSKVRWIYCAARLR